VAVIGSILASQYSANLTKSLAGTPAQRYLPEAERSLASAMRAAPHAPSVQSQLTAIARQSFVDALHVVGWAVTGAGLACALLVWFILGSAALSDRAEASESGGVPTSVAPTLAPEEP